MLFIDLNVKSFKSCQSGLLFVLNLNYFPSRCRGLPWSATADEVEEFFKDCKLANGNFYSFLFFQSESNICSYKFDILLQAKIAL